MPSEGFGFLLRVGSVRGTSVSPRFARHAMAEAPMPHSSPKSRTSRRPALPESASLRVVVLGAANVGKTHLVKHLHQPNKPKLRSTKSAPTRKTSITEFTHVEFTENNQILQLDLLDTSGYDGFPVMLELSVQQAQAFILVCAADNESSFERVKELRQEILRIKGQQGVRHFPVVVVVNKTDLPQTPSSLSLAYAELAVLCDWGDCGFTKCCANDEDSTRGILREMLNQVNTLQSRRLLALQVLTGKIQRRKTMPRSAKLAERNRAQSPIGKNLSLPVEFDHDRPVSPKSPKPRSGSFRFRKDSPTLARSLPTDYTLFSHGTPLSPKPRSGSFGFKADSPRIVYTRATSPSSSTHNLRLSTI